MQDLPASLAERLSRKLEPATVPTLSTWSLGALVSAVALAGAVLLRRRS